jgi:ribosomal protein S6E (S10)
MVRISVLSQILVAFECGHRPDQLCCERRKLLKRGETVGMELPLSDHVRSLDSSQGRLGRMEGLEA